MEKSALIAIIAVVIIVAAGGIGYTVMNKDKDGDSSPGEVTDALGRNIMIPENLDNGIVTVGSTGPLRFASMFDVRDKVIEVDKGDITDNRNGRAYSYAYDYYKMDESTQSHADNKLETATAEAIGNKGPSLVITSVGVWNNYAYNFETLAKKCTVVVIKDQQMQYMTGDDGKLADFMTFNINLLGKVLKKESRAEELINGINNILSDIYSLKGASNQAIYVAGVTISGSNALNTTFPVYMPFGLTGSKNAYTGTSTESKVVLNVEDFANMDIDMIIVDPSSSDKINGNIDSQNVLKRIYTLNNDEDLTNDIPIYITVPIVWDSINYDCSLASAYYVAYLNYGTLTLEQVEEKINGIFTTFYGDHGTNVFNDMKQFFVEKSSNNGQEMPVLGEVVIQEDAGVYRFVAA